ncbi:hypothetical protein FRC03_011917 [Tulasnella sp. 419]|nr:hypothetical protein FRC02_001158 [Tulasnella sp. 418]KAG8966468.1 hypothetical protein FRC03_011917 [Tulasnella sp. 419]
MACSGNRTQICGGGYRLSVYGPAAMASSKLVVAHFMVGNTYSYTSATWLKQIQLAAAQGIDAFALNIGGYDSWTDTQLSSAYNTATSSGTGFRMFISFDATAIPCDNNGANLIRRYISTYAGHAAQLKDAQGRAYFSNFAGESCTFGRGSVDAGWRYVTKEGLPSTVFLPSFFTDPASFSSTYPTSMDGYFLWNGGWPMGNYQINWGPDAQAIAGTRNGRPNALYMAAVSPWFFTHYGPNSWNKNWIYRADDWMYIKRWEDLFAHRNEIDLVQIVTWNDYGESSYIGPIEKDQPNSQAWVNGFDHNGWLKLVKYYATGFKNGAYPPITQDQIYLWARPHGKNDVASSDSVGRPNNADWTQDYLWAVLFSTGTGTLTLSSGSNTQSFNVVAGVNRFQLAQNVGGVNARLVRGSTTIFNFTPSGFTFTHSPSTYNFNAYVASYP